MAIAKIPVNNKSVKPAIFRTPLPDNIPVKFEKSNRVLVFAGRSGEADFFLNSLRIKNITNGLCRQKYGFFGRLIRDKADEVGFVQRPLKSPDQLPLNRRRGYASTLQNRCW